MILISHRGNISGIELGSENSPNLIKQRLSQGYDVEIDVWFLDDKFYLGHDNPQYLVDVQFLKDPRLWCHAKNLDSLNELLKNEVNCFWHQQDDFTLTSRNIIWTYPGKPLSENSVIVCNDREKIKQFRDQKIYGICSDYVSVIKEGI